GEATAFELWDRDGAPLGRIGSLRRRPLSAEEIGAGRREETLFGIEWTEVSLTGRDAAPPDVELMRCETDGAGSSKAARKAAQTALEALQRWSADESKADSRLALITQGAMVTADEEVPDSAATAIWGLVRSAQSENPGRFVLIDSDGSEASTAALPAALGQTEEPQLALRAGAALAPRLVRLPDAQRREDEAPVFDPDRTVLLTGATGGLGALIARHLVVENGARRLLLVSRSGPEAEGAEELQAELEELGAKVRIAACDVSQRNALAALLDSLPAEHPLGAVIHAAGALADATIESLGEEDLERVFAPKADAAWHLHELTRDAELSAFVAFSSAAATFGNPGQGNYAAANSFLDALAQRRRAEGLPAISIAWGLWETTSAMTEDLGEVGRKRLERKGVGALTEEQGLALFDAALGADRSLAVAIRIQSQGLRSLASVGVLPPIFSGLIRTPRRRAAEASSALREHLATLSGEERERALLELVRSQVAAVLGHESADEIGPGKAFQDLGFDSLSAVELRNRLAMVIDMTLPPTLVIDYPTTTELSAFLHSEMDTTAEPTPTGISAGKAFLPLLEAARRQGKFGEFTNLITAAANLRPTFDSPLSAGVSPKAIELADGAEAPSLILLSSVVATSGPQEYLRFAGGFRGERAVLVPPHLGFIEGEPLPSTVGVAAAAHAETILRDGPEGPIALVGYSSGAWIAHAMAGYLEQKGVPAAAVILLDPPATVSDAWAWFEPLLLTGLQEGDRAPVPLDDARLTASIAYFEMFADWRPQELATPVVMMQAGERVEGMENATSGRRAEFWAPLTSVVDVPGNHFTLMTDHASSTTQAVRDFLDVESNPKVDR
ncbi:MAG TPA: type I polyketide synthase, partial [Solirubrobacterales bacterium]|nr:type I polyketide synthase [Solirubrobacterales bacterium]